MKENDAVTQKITIIGLVQGIGFRPFVYNLANRLELAGSVRNCVNAVEIVVQGQQTTVDAFIDVLKNEPPPLARIDKLTSSATEHFPDREFSILQSEDTTNDVTDISPDIAVCNHCLADMKTQPHRIGYPLINCTLCGPRFSIIRSVPYDRPGTTMAPFEMCPTCMTEYTDPTDRRFHAQPIACNECGPVYTMYAGAETVEGNADVIDTTAKMIEEGKVVAVKGTGGFHLACSPFFTDALRKLRSGKRRDGKPFALMFRDLATLRRFATVSNEEERLLASTIRPIVLLDGTGGETLPSEVNTRLPTIGAMLPYMPFHHLLFGKLSIPAIVMTSGNISEEPIVIDNETAKETFAGIAGAMVVYNRAIHNRVDDSVCAIFDRKVQLLRRSRGFAPSPVNLTLQVEGIAATGAEVKNCFALGKGNKAIISQHIGDLKNSATMDFYREAFDRLCTLFRIRPERIAHDSHPDYLSSGFAHGTGLPTIAVQHHHAHIAACCAENGIDEKVIGVALDGTGYGTDGAIWGGEFLFADFCGFERITHLRYAGMPGGDRAAVEPWRMAASWLYECDGSDFTRYRDMFFPAIPEHNLTLIDAALENGINTPQTSSAGRLFDAVTALCGLCDEMSFEAEAAMRLEAVCGDPLSVSPYQWNREKSIDLRPTIHGIVHDRQKGTDIRTIATRFHATMIDIVTATCGTIRSDTGCDTVVLSGGCFQNRCIFEGTVRMLQENNFTVFTHHQVPCNDGGIALGQLAIAAAGNN